jgi:hypothetical protein
MRATCSVLSSFALTMFLASCGGGDDDTPARHEVDGLISSLQVNPASPTSSTSVAVQGFRSTSVSSVTWSNSAGGSGAATLGTCPAFPAPIPLPCFQATIDLNFGSNSITFVGENPRDGEFTQLTISVTRI